MKITAALPQKIKVSDTDLCVLLSNALENAIHATAPFAEAGEECLISVQLFEKGGKVFLQVMNPSKETVRLKKGIPVSEHPGHGFGVQSICAIVERYHGVVAFLQENGNFILRLSI